MKSTLVFSAAFRLLACALALAAGLDEGPVDQGRTRYCSSDPKNPHLCDSVPTRLATSGVSHCFALTPIDAPPTARDDVRGQACVNAIDSDRDGVLDSLDIAIHFTDYDSSILETQVWLGPNTRTDQDEPTVNSASKETYPASDHLQTVKHRLGLEHAMLECCNESYSWIHVLMRAPIMAIDNETGSMTSSIVTVMGSVPASSLLSLLCNSEKGQNQVSLKMVNDAKEKASIFSFVEETGSGTWLVKESWCFIFLLATSHTIRLRTGLWFRLSRAVRSHKRQKSRKIPKHRG